MKHKVAIIGSGPAGLSAGIYTARAEMEVTIYAGPEPGGQLTKTTEIENYPGGDGLMGPELMVKIQQQAEKFGAKVVYEKVIAITDDLKVKTESGEEQYQAILIATGASPRLLGVGESEYFGRGFSTCAVCDASFYRDRKVVVVGGGDAAVEDALALTKFASEVTMLVRRDELRASKAMQKKVLNNPLVKIRWETELVGVEGEERLERIKVLVKKEREEMMEIDGLFLAIGHIPATKWLEGSKVRLDKAGYVMTGITGLRDGEMAMQELWLKGFPTMTSQEGVFAGGDCVDYRYRQAITASGMGVMMALDAERWLGNEY